MKASARAYPIQGLVKYHGLLDRARRIPYHDSISVCTGRIHSHTTVEVLDKGDVDQAVIDGKVAAGRTLDRVRAVVDAIRPDARPFRMESQNDFPQFVGLGSSASGFAALAVAAAAAYGVQRTHEELSEAARLGAGSASRAVTGGISDWRTTRERSYATQILAPDDLDWAIVVPLVRHEEPTDGVHDEVVKSPLFKARLAYLDGALARARKACREGDLEALWDTAEADTLNLHAVTMTAPSRHVTWQPATLAVMRAAWTLRASGTPVYFSIDTGATAYLNCHRKDADEVERAVAKIDGVAELLRLEPAGAARPVDDHLF